MRVKLFVLIFAAVCFVDVGSMRAAIIHVEDGGSHTIDHSLYQNDSVCLDMLTVNDPGTHLDLVNGGEIWDIGVYNTSTIKVSGGLISNVLDASGNSIVDIFGGTISGSLSSHSNSAVNVSGGYIELLYVNGGSTVTLTGGDINSATVGLNVSDDASITFVCDLDSLNYSYDQSLLVGITGSWLDGSNFDVEVQNLGYNPTSDYINFVPEPATLVLFGLGGLFLRNRKL